jgi:hypothetical protein
MTFTITCNNQKEFVEICAELVRQGISFDADTDSGWAIYCTGAF